MVGFTVQACGIGDAQLRFKRGRTGGRGERAAVSASRADRAHMTTGSAVRSVTMRVSGIWESGGPRAVLVEHHHRSDREVFSDQIEVGNSDR
jgi:hypothetical protein